MNTQPIDIRLSAYKVGTKATPRFVWGVGVEREFLDRFPEENRKARLAQVGGKLQIQLGTEGVKLSSGGNGRIAYAQAGEHHLSGLQTPNEEIRAVSFAGAYDAKRNMIEFLDQLPDFVTSRFVDIEKAKADAAPEAHFPGTHFMEDVKEAEQELDHPLSTHAGALKWFEDQVQRSQQGDFTIKVGMTPALARVLLDHNEGNRPTRQAKLEQYASDMAEGRWIYNGETIIIAKQGLVNNGQHRSHAVLATGVTIPTLFVFGVERESRKTVDTGATRGPQDHLSSDGFPQPTTLAAITRFVLSYEDNDGNGFANLNRVSGAEVYDRAKSELLLDEASRYPYTNNNKSKKLAPPSVIGFCFYEFSKIDPVAAKVFMDQVTTGVNLAANSPAYIVREKLSEMRSLHREQKIEILFRGWLAYRANKTIKSIRILWELPQL